MPTARLPAGLRRIFTAARLRRAFTEDIAFKVLAALMAIAVWAWVQGQTVVDARARIRIEYLWPAGLVRSRPVPKTLVATLNGPQGAVRALENERLWVQVDLQDAEQGTVAVDFGALTVQQLPPGVQVVQLSPPAIEIELDRDFTREVEVHPQLTGEPRPGWVVVGSIVTPSTVPLVGPQTTMQQLSSILTEPIEISGLDKDLVLTTGLVVPDRLQGLDQYSSHQVTVTIEVEPVIGEAQIVGVPVRVRGQANRVVEPALATLQVRGPVGTLPELNAKTVRLELVGVPLQGKVRVDGSVEGVDLRMVVDPPGAEAELVMVEPGIFEVQPPTDEPR